MGGELGLNTNCEEKEVCVIHITDVQGISQTHANVHTHVHTRTQSYTVEPLYKNTSLKGHLFQPQVQLLHAFQPQKMRTPHYMGHFLLSHYAFEQHQYTENKEEEDQR